MPCGGPSGRRRLAKRIGHVQQCDGFFPALDHRIFRPSPKKTAGKSGGFIASKSGSAALEALGAALPGRGRDRDRIGPHPYRARSARASHGARPSGSASTVAASGFRRGSCKADPRIGDLLQAGGGLSHPVSALAQARHRIAGFGRPCCGFPSAAFCSCSPAALALAGAGIGLAIRCLAKSRTAVSTGGHSFS
jgi:hypothetical protein